MPVNDDDATASLPPRETTLFSVKETAVADVQLNDDGAPSQVNGYRVLKQLGEGTTSKVYHCQDDQGREFALKILNKSFLKRKREYKKVDGKMVFSNAFTKVQKEVAIMKKLAHENLVKLHEIIDSPADDKMVLVLELITGGQVMKWDDKAFRYRCPRAASGVLAHDDVRRCMRDVIDALDYLHKNFICHRDIKPENILLGGNDSYKLADFGVAHMLDESVDKKTLRNTEGTYHFLAPECTTGNEYDPYRVDIWALGVTMFTLLFGTLPFGTEAASLTDVMDSIRVDPLEIDAAALGDAECEQVLRAMMTKDPMDRVTLKQLQVHPWFLHGAESPAPPRGEPSRVEVTREEIEAAFTPVNNFILMVRIKMKMAGRLARARNSIDLAKSQLAGAAAAATDHVTGLRHAQTCTGPVTTAVVPAALPALDNPTKADDTSLVAAVTANSPSSASPAKAAASGFFAKRHSVASNAAALLTKRHSVNADAPALPSPPYDGVLPLHDSETSPSRPHTATLVHKPSVLKDKLVIGDLQLDDATASNTRDNAVSPPQSVTIQPRESRTAHAETPAESACAVRLSPEKTAMMQPVGADLRLPKLEIASVTNSPATSPLSSPVHRRLTPRYSRENPVTTSDDATDETESEEVHRQGQLAVKKSPTTDKRHRTTMLHQGVVHPASVTHSVEVCEVKEVDVEDEADDAIAVETPSPLGGHAAHKRKTQDEAKLAIAGIVSRSAAERASPTASPVKEPSVMLHHRKSSTTDTSFHTELPTHHTHRQANPPLPSLSDQTGRPRWAQSPSRPDAVGLTPLVDEPESKRRSSRPSPSKKHSPLRSRRSEHSIQSERGVCSNGRASSYATSHVGTEEPEEGDAEATSRDGSSPASSPTTESAKTLRHLKFQDLSLVDCLPPPEESGLFVVDPSTQAVHTDTSSSDDVASPSPMGSPPAGRKSSPIRFGLFRKKSNSEVVPITAMEEAQYGDASGSASIPSRQPHSDYASPTRKRKSPKTSPAADLLPSPHKVKARSAADGDAAAATSPTTQDLAEDPASTERVFSRRSMIESQHDSIRLLLLRRTESVKALLAGKKAPSGPADPARARGSPTLAAIPKRQATVPSLATSPPSSPSRPRASFKSSSCVIQ